MHNGEREREGEQDSIRHKMTPSVFLVSRDGNFTLDEKRGKVQKGFLLLYSFSFADDCIFRLTASVEGSYKTRNFFAQPSFFFYSERHNVWKALSREGKNRVFATVAAAEKRLLNSGEEFTSGDRSGGEEEEATDVSRLFSSSLVEKFF